MMIIMAVFCSNLILRINKCEQKKNKNKKIHKRKLFTLVMRAGDDDYHGRV